MARPQKTGLDYFPLDTDMDQDDKISLIEAKHGIVGFGVVIKLFLKIYREGYFYKWGEREQLLFSKRVNVNINNVNDIINDAIKWNLFSSELFEKYKILTSIGIQRRYVECAKRRQKIEMVEKYTLLCKDDVNVYENLVFVNINQIDEVINPQSKGKESKGKETKKEIYCRVVSYLNKKTGKQFKNTSKKTQELITSRLNEKFTEEDFFTVIDNKSSKWLKDPKMCEYLRPETLFGTKFESYLNDTGGGNGTSGTSGGNNQGKNGKNEGEPDFSAYDEGASVFKV